MEDLKLFDSLELHGEYYTEILQNVTAESNDTQISNLNKLIKSRSAGNPSHAESWTRQDISNLSPTYIIPQEGSMEADKIDKLPGPGCSSFGYGAMEELGPFRVNSDGKTLYRNDYAWNNVANVIFLESPAGVGFSYSNRSSDYKTGDKQTAKDSYTFLINWLNRFPQYKTRDFFITGESYAGHYVPQLASLILSENKKTSETVINLKGIAIGNAWIDETTYNEGSYVYYWTHALISDETNAGINKYCDYFSGKFSDTCIEYQSHVFNEYGRIDLYNIYAPLCYDGAQKPGSPGSVSLLFYDIILCTYLHIYDIINCPDIGWTDSPTTILPTIKQLIADGIIVWIYSGDIDGRIPVTSSRYSVNKLKIPVVVPWRPWYYNKEVGGYVVGYRGSMVLTTIRAEAVVSPMHATEPLQLSGSEGDATATIEAESACWRIFLSTCWTGAIKRKAPLGADHGAFCNTRLALSRKRGLFALFVEAGSDLPSFWQWWTISIEILVDRGPSRLKNIANAPQKSKGKGASSSSTPKVPPPKKTESKRLHQLIDEDDEDDEEMEEEFGVSEDDEEDVELGIDVDDEEEEDSE
ncbi:hypothetical protein E3N88_20763 [Mikania micrantha]|uniref:Carboxypeptidase n=1 Tax=Mikania micrantha TaxID=192012 RepID=A0A5N6NJM3_9ASTR|nr:hypothetical protein E3N88_20763 [Mikania micrantha]